MPKLIPYEGSDYHFRVETEDFSLTLNDKHNRIDRDEVEVWNWRTVPPTLLADCDNLEEAIDFAESFIGELITRY